MSRIGMALTCAIALPALLTPVPAAADSDGSAAGTSAVGGELLSRAGTQVQPRTGAPDLPDGLSAKSWIIADAETGEVLAAKNAHRQRAPASTLKMLLAVTLLEQLDRDDVYRADSEDLAQMGEGSSAVGVTDGQTYTVEDLWHGVFLASGNDAAYSLAAMNGGVEKTVREMNERAEELQAYDTHVVNPDGYDADGQVSSAYDLTLIAREGMQNADFREYAATVTAEFPGEGSGKNRETYEIQSTNRLLTGTDGLEAYEGLAGIKNGYTSEAGSTFTGVAERDGQVLLVTVMDPRGDGLEVYREAADLLDWGFEASGMVDPVGDLVAPQSETEKDTEDDEQAGGESGDAKQAPMNGASGSTGGQASVSGVAVLAVTVASLIVLAAAAFLYHRRHPLPAATRPRPPRRPPRPPPAD